MITKTIYEKYPLVWERITEKLKAIQMQNHEIGLYFNNLVLASFLPYEEDYAFSDIPFSMLYGLLVDFFDENGFYISIYYYYEREIKIALFAFAISSGKLNSVDAYTEKIYTRHEAQKQAILKAAEIMEERLK